MGMASSTNHNAVCMRRWRAHIIATHIPPQAKQVSKADVIPHNFLT